MSGEDNDPSSPVGLGWKSKFSTSDKCIAQEKETARHVGVCHGEFENELNYDPAKAVTFGDGQPWLAHTVQDCSKILDEECVAIPSVKNYAGEHDPRDPKELGSSYCV
ncbi:hypothetical protein Tco_0913594 [Tanacetum coccineum]